MTIMQRDEAISLIRTSLPELTRRYGIKSISVFGSTARNEASFGSDVDILADFGRAPAFDDYMDVKFFLEDLLHAKVDLVTPAGLRSPLRPIIEHEAVRVA